LFRILKRQRILEFHDERQTMIRSQNERGDVRAERPTCAVDARAAMFLQKLVSLTGQIEKTEDFIPFNYLQNDRAEKSQEKIQPVFNARKACCTFKFPQVVRKFLQPEKWRRVHGRAAQHSRFDSYAIQRSHAVFDVVRARQSVNTVIIRNDQ